MELKQPETEPKIVLYRVSFKQQLILVPQLPSVLTVNPKLYNLKLKPYTLNAKPHLCYKF